MGVLADPVHQVEGCGGPLGDPGHDVGGRARSPRRRGRRQVEQQQPRTDDRAEPVMEVAAAHRADRDVAVVAEVAEHLGEDAAACRRRRKRDGSVTVARNRPRPSPSRWEPRSRSSWSRPSSTSRPAKGLSVRAWSRSSPVRSPVAPTNEPRPPGPTSPARPRRAKAHVTTTGVGNPPWRSTMASSVGVTVGAVEEGRAVVGLGGFAVANPGRQSTRELGQHAEGGRHHVVILEVGDHDPRQPVDDRGEALRAELVQEQRAGPRGRPAPRRGSRARRVASSGVATAARCRGRAAAPRARRPSRARRGRGRAVVRIVHHGPGRARSPMVEGHGVADRDGPVGRVEGARHDGRQARLPGRHHTDGPAPALGRVARLGLPAAHRRGLGDRRGEGPSQHQDRARGRSRGSRSPLRHR